MSSIGSIARSLSLIRVPIPVFALVALLTTLCSAANAETWAVLIGVSDYRYRTQIATLGGAANDARALKRILVERLQVPEDHVQLLVADPGRPADSPDPLPDRSEILNALERLRYAVKPDDTIYLFFAGHGISIKEETYLLPYDASNLSANSLVNTALNISDIKNLLSGIPARARIIALDMCRSEPRTGSGDSTVPNRLTAVIERGMDFVPFSSPKNAPKSKTPPISAVLFACSLNQRSYEWADKGRGYFSYFLEEGLGGKAADNKGQVTVDSLSRYVRGQVQSRVAALGYEQVPFAKTTGAGAERYILTKMSPDTPAWDITRPLPDYYPSTTTIVHRLPRIEWYTNDPTIVGLINDEEVKSGASREGKVDSDGYAKFTFSWKTFGIRGVPLKIKMPEDSKLSKMVLRTQKGVLIPNWSAPSEFFLAAPITNECDERTAKSNSGIPVGDWELSNLKVEFRDQYTQTDYTAHRSVPTLAPSGEQQKLVVVSAKIKNTGARTKSLLLVHLEGSETAFPYDESRVLNRKGPNWQIAAHDANANDSLEVPLESGKSETVRWIFRVPRDASAQDINHLCLSLLWTTNGIQKEIPQHGLVTIHFNNSVGSQRKVVRSQ